MSFLCHAHRNELAALSPNEKMDLWFTWMAEAGNQSDARDWQQVVRYAGCAFDLAATSVREPNPAMAVEMILAAICLSEALRKMACQEAADAIIELAISRLHPDTTAELAVVLTDEHQRQRFFSDYMSWPAMAPSAGPQREAETIH